MAGTDVVALPSPRSNAYQYQTLIEAFPHLGADEERALAERLHNEQDLQAAWRLVTSHLRYVVYIARGYKGYGIPQEDLIQEGNLGLMKAVRRFDPSRGVRLVAYASYWIRAQIHDFILKNWRIVKIATTKAKRKLFYKLRSTKERLEWLNQAQAGAIAEALDVSPDDVLDMEGRLYARDESFDGPAGADGDEVDRSPAAYVTEDRFDPATTVADAEFRSVALDTLDSAMGMLDSRSRDILESRWLKEGEHKLTLHDLGERHGVSAERIRQLEAAAIKRLRDVMLPRLAMDAGMAG